MSTIDSTRRTSQPPAGYTPSTDLEGYWIGPEYMGPDGYTAISLGWSEQHGYEMHSEGFGSLHLRIASQPNGARPVAPTLEDVHLLIEGLGAIAAQIRANRVGRPEQE